MDHTSDPEALLRRLVTNASVKDLADLRALTETDAARTQPLGDPAAAPLPADETAELIAHSGLEPAGRQRLETVLSDPASVRAVAAQARMTTLANLLRSTVDVEGAAELLHRHRTAVTRAIQDGRLYAVPTGPGMRIPSWQFRQGRYIPGLERVVRAIPLGQHPMSVHALMTASLDSLDGESPVDWLVSGGDPGPVVDQVQAMGAW